MLNLPRMFAAKAQETTKLIMIHGQSIKQLQSQNQRFFLKFIKHTLKRLIGINIAKKRCEIFANITHKDDFWNVKQVSKPISTQVNCWLEDFHLAQQEINERRELDQDEDENNNSVLLYKIKRTTTKKVGLDSPIHLNKRRNLMKKRHAVNLGMQRMGTLVGSLN